MSKALRLLVKIVVLLILSTAIIYRHAIATYWRGLSDPVIDLLLYIGGGLITAFVGILGGHVATDKKRYRWTFYLCGIVLAAIIITSGIRNYRAMLAAVPPKEIVMEAVNKANEHTDKAIEKADQHTDEQIAMVRNDLKGVEVHSDKQIAEVREDLKTTGHTVTGVLADNTAALVKRMDTLKPPAPQFARLQFSFYVNSQLDKFPLLVKSLQSGKDSTFVVDFMVRNVADVAAEKGDLWVLICDACRYTRDPSGFVREPGADEHQRHQSFERINSDVSIKISVELSLDGQFGNFDTSFKYACASCGPVKDWQTLKTMVLPSR